MFTVYIDQLFACNIAFRTPLFTSLPSLVQVSQPYKAVDGISDFDRFTLAGRVISVMFNNIYRAKSTRLNRNVRQEITL